MNDRPQQVAAAGLVAKFPHTTPPYGSTPPSPSPELVTCMALQIAKSSKYKLSPSMLDTLSLALSCRDT